MNRRILFTGDRDWTNVSSVQAVLATLDPDDIVVAGRARGLDNLVLKLADAWEPPFATFAFPAQWKRMGRSAGPQRNRRQLRESQAQVVIWFHDDLKHSQGTRDMVLYAAQQAGVVVYSWQKWLDDHAKGDQTDVHEDTGSEEGEDPR